MLVNVYNNGQTEPIIQLTGKYLNSTSVANQSSYDGAYVLSPNSVALLKVEIVGFDTSLLAVKSKFTLGIKQVQETGANFRLYEINESSFNKNIANDVTLGTLLDTIVYNGIASKYQSNVEDTIDFDITKYMYNKLIAGNFILENNKKKITLYFAVQSDSYTYKLCPFESMDGSFSMQLNSLKGLDTSYEFDQEEIGFAGISSINLANGKMIHKVEAIQTASEDNPAVFHLFHNPERNSLTTLGNNWVCSGDYECIIDEANETIKLVDPSLKTLILNKRTKEDIEELYSLKVVESDIESEEFYVCYSEPMYAILDSNSKDKIIFVDKSENKMIFNSINNILKLKDIELNNDKYTHYFYTSDGLLRRIYNSEGERLEITYRNGAMYTVDLFNNSTIRAGHIQFIYSNNNLFRILYYFGPTTNVIKEAMFIYDANQRLIDVRDNKAGIASRFHYNNSGQVVKVDHVYLEDDQMPKYTTYDYYTFQTRVTDYIGRFTDYYFDYFGRCKNIIDFEAKSITRNYDEVIDGNLGNLNSESNVQINERNLIDNHSFDSADKLFDNDSSWELEQGVESYAKIIDGGVYGGKCLRINKTTMPFKLKQVLKNISQGTYTLNSFFKALVTSSNNMMMTPCSIKVKVNVSYKETITTSIADENNNLTTETNTYEKTDSYELSKSFMTSFDWIEQRNGTVVIPGGENISDLIVELFVELTGMNYTAYIDDISLTYGDHIVRHNFVNNGYFENGLNGWVISNKTSLDGVCTVGTSTGHHMVLGDNVLKLTSDLSKIKTISRTILMRGGAGDELLLSLFGKGNTTKNDVFRAFIKIHYIDTNSNERFDFDFDSNYEYWQVLTRKIIADRAYDSVEIGVDARSKSDIYIDAIQLYKDSFGKEYSYTEKQNMSEMVNADGTFANITYDDKSNVTESTDESGDTYRYVYDEDKKRIIQISNNQNTKVLFKYDENCDKKTETKLVSSKGEILKTNQTYDAKARLSSQTDDYGIVTEFAYDGMDRQISETAANGLVTTFKYNANNMLSEQLSKLDDIQSKCTYTYDQYGNIKTITCDDSTLYEFTYNKNQQVQSVTVDGQYFVKNCYDKVINGVNTNLLTKQILGEDDSHGYYIFAYDDKQRLKTISFNNVLQVEYEYDEYNRVSKIIDNCADIEEYLSYDGKGQLVSVTNNEGNSIVYDYDNLNNLQKTTFDIDGVLRSFDYEYKCEYNDYTPSGYFSRLQRAFPDEVIKGGSGLNGVYGAKARLKTIKGSTINVEDETPLNEVVASLAFKEDNAILSYPFATMNKERKAESTTEKTFTYNKWNSEFRNRKTVYGWIKPLENPIGEQRIFGLSTDDSFGFRFKLFVNTDKTISLVDSSSDIGNDVNFRLNTTSQLVVGEWNLVGFEIDYNYSNKIKTVTLVLNEEIISGTYSDELSMDALKFFVIGEASPSLVSSNYTTTDNSVQNVPINMPFKLAYASVGGTNISRDDFVGIYEQGQKYLKTEPNYGASGVTFFDETVYNGFDVITLNGSLSSLKRMKPKVHSYTEASFKVEKSRMFKFDNTGVNPLYRHVYASYNADVNLNKGNHSKLAYDLLLNNLGTITLRFKLDELIETNGKRVILYSGDGITQKMKLYTDSNNKLFLEDDGNSVYEMETVSLDEWHFLSLRFNSSGVTINLDGLSYNTSLIKFNLNNFFTYIGCSVNEYEKPIEHLNGCIEMLAFKSSFATEEEIQSIRNNGESYSVRTYYDELGRTAGKSIYSKDNVLTKQYWYKSKNGLTTTKLLMEESFDNQEYITYDYDNVGNLKRIEIDKDGLITDKFYTYDCLSRLVSSTINGVTKSYVYDLNNNIKFKNGIEYFYDETIKDRLISRSDGTTITYDTTGFMGNPTKITKPLQEIELSWNGRRLASVIDTATEKEITFGYNASGIRVSKETDEYTEQYILDGSKIAVLKRTVNNVTKALNFIYDEAQMLVGFTYNGNEYFYDRLVNGEIRYIIDKTGHVYVSYEYDDWGMPTYVSDGTTIGNELLELNPFMYKGYFYDREIKMYYLKSRYYDPDLGRFINADAEVGSVGETMGMNLYAYCKCNPICYADENGNWPSWATKVCIGLAVIAVCAVVAAVCVATGGAAACVATSMLVGAVKGALIGAVAGAITGAVTGAVSEGIKTGTWEGAWKGAIKGAIEGAADGFMWGAIGGTISGAMNPKFCFVAGTLVMTKQGLKAIEEIKVGDQVLSYNDNLEIFEYKDVVELYNNETEELCHIYTEYEEIVCTPNHSVLTIDGWKEAKELTNKDLIKTSTGYVKVLSIKLEQLEEKQSVYNFNVLGYHTYVVGNDLLVVHNACNIKEGATEKVQYNYNGSKTSAYNTGGGNTYYAVDKAGHGGSCFKGFKLSKNKKKLTWIGDFDENLKLITGKHKDIKTMVFDVIKMIQL